MFPNRCVCLCVSLCVCVRVHVCVCVRRPVIVLEVLLYSRRFSHRTHLTTTVVIYYCSTVLLYDLSKRCTHPLAKVSAECCVILESLFTVYTTVLYYCDTGVPIYSITGIYY